MKKSVHASFKLRHTSGFLARKLLQQGYYIAPDLVGTNNNKKYLIINGDDLGKDEKTNKAIVSAFKGGILTSTSAFVNLQDSVEQLRKVHAEMPSLPIGLHLNMTWGPPVSDAMEVPHLTDRDGQFFPIDRLLRYLPDIPIDEVRKEFYAQARRFISTGIPMNHINSHFHLAALYTPFFKVMRELALKYRVPLRNPVPASIYNLIHLNGNGGAGTTGMRKLIQFGIFHPFKLLPIIKKIRPQSLLEQAKLMQAEGIRSTDWFIDLFYSNASTTTFISILEQLPHGISEIMCHPVNESELAVLTDPAVRKVIDELNIELISWNQIN